MLKVEVMHRLDESGNNDKLIRLCGYVVLTYIRFNSEMLYIQIN